MTYNEAKIVFYAPQNQKMKFRLFYDCDLEVNSEIQSQLCSCHMDDDNPTDTELLEIATHHCQKDLFGWMKQMKDESQ